MQHDRAVAGQDSGDNGAASGIGLACARAMMAEAAEVILIDRDGERLAALVAEMGQAPMP